MLVNFENVENDKQMLYICYLTIIEKYDISAGHLQHLSSYNTDNYKSDLITKDVSVKTI